MYYRLEYSENMTEYELNQALADIPADTTTFELSDTMIGEHLDDLYRVLIALPPSVITLDLRDNNIQYEESNGFTLAQVLSVIPPTVEILILDNNCLSILKRYLADVFRALPRGIHTLSLSNINFAEIWIRLAEILQVILPALPPTIKSLDLSENILGDESEISIDMANALALIPASVETLNLANNKLNQRTLYSVALMTHALPATIRTLDLSLNAFSKCWDAKDEGQKADHEDNRFLYDCHKLFGQINAINQINGFDEIDVRGYTVFQWMQIIAGLPRELLRLALDFSDYTGKTDTELTQIFAALPPSLETLEFVTQQSALNQHELLRIVRRTPSQVNTLIVHETYLCSIERALDLIVSLPPHIKNIGVRGGEIQPTDDYLFDAVFPLSIQNPDFFVASDTNPIRPLVPMTEPLCSRLIDYLEQYPSPNNLFVCGMLLEGRISSTRQPDLSLDNHDVDENQLLKAFNFYVLAGEQNDAVKSITDYFLWFRKHIVRPPKQMRRANDMMEQLDVTPHELIPGYSFFRKKPIARKTDESTPVETSALQVSDNSDNIVYSEHAHRTTVGYTRRWPLSIPCPVDRITPEILNHIVPFGSFKGQSVAFVILLNQAPKLLDINRKRLANALSSDCLNHIIRTDEYDGWSVALLLAQSEVGLKILSKDDYRLAKMITPECLHCTSLEGPFGAMQSVASNLSTRRLYRSARLGQEILSIIEQHHLALQQSSPRYG